MALSRREFIKQMGIAFASLVLTQCRRRGEGRSDRVITCYTPAVLPTPVPTPTPMVTCYEVQVLPTPTPTDQLERKKVLTDTISSGDVNMDTVRRAQAANARERLRDCWRQLDGLAQQAGQDYEQASQAKSALVETHRAVLDELVSLDELGAQAATLVHAAFEEAAFHVWRANAPLTCYLGLPIQYEPCEDLVLRAEMLADVARDLDPAVVAEAQDALARDIAFLGALEPDGPTDAQLLALWRSRDIAADAQAVEAARYLGALLSQGAG